MATYQPRPYQAECIAALAEARANGAKKGLVVMASGLGKTLTIIFDLQQFLQEWPNARILYLCHQESILAQSKAKFKKVFGDEYSYGMLTGYHKTTRAVTFLFATFQTMCDYREKFAVDAFDYVIVDEAHHTVAETYQPTVDYFAPQFLIGLTATKDRMDGQDILEVYEQIFYQMDIYDGWEQDWLARVDYRIMLDDLKQEEFEKYVGPHATTEKVSMTQLNKTIFAPQHDEGIVASIREQTADLDNPSMFVFCSSIEHAKAMAHCFEGEAAVIHSRQSYSANQAILSKFRAGKIRIIISVDMLNEGIDVPETDAIVFLRSTESSTIFFQQLGRGLRISGNKRMVRVLDYVANIERIATILEMEQTAKERIVANPSYTPSADKPEPLVVNIPATKFKVKRVDVERLLTKIAKPRHWTREEAIESLQNLARKLGKNSLSVVDDINGDADAPSNPTLKALFGSSAEGIIAAGLEPEFSVRGKFETEAELFAAVREYAAKLGHPETISTKEIDGNYNLPPWGSLSRKYKTITNFRRQAGFANPGAERKAKRKLFHSKEEIDAAILRKSDELGGKTPTQRQLESDPSCPSYRQIRKFYTTANAAFAANGLQAIRTYKSPEAYTFEAQKAEALAMRSQLGKTPTRLEWDANPKTCSVTCLEQRYGSYNNAMSSFGLKPNEQNSVIGIESERLASDLIDRLQCIVKKTGKPIRLSDLKNANDVPCRIMFCRKGWNTKRINEYIGTDQILAEMKKKNS